MLVTGCAKDTNDLYAYIDQAKTKHVGSVEPLPQFAPYVSFTYSAGDLRDPFVAAIDHGVVAIFCSAKVIHCSIE